MVEYTAKEVGEVIRAAMRGAKAPRRTPVQAEWFRPE